MLRQHLQRKEKIPPAGDDRAPSTKGRIPDSPGVYFFLGRRRKILYIGRATSLRNRVRSYFTPDIAEKRSAWIAKMLTEAKRVDFRETDSVLEAILLEADLIKKFQPPYNTDEKDDKSFNCVVITDEKFPRVLLIRKREVDSYRKRLNLKSEKRFNLVLVYGPFTNGGQLKTALKIIRKIFPFRDAKCRVSSEVQPQKGPEVEPRKLRPCFNRQIGLCPGVCTGEISKQEYAKTIRNIRLFFEGKKDRLLKLLEKEMKTEAERQEFEKAGEVKRQILALTHIQDVSLLKRTPHDERRTTHVRIEAYDLSHFGGKESVGAMTVTLGGTAAPSEYRHFKIRGIQGAHETKGLSEMLRRRFRHPEWRFPELIVVDGNEIQKNAAEQAIAERGLAIPVVAVVKDERHRPREILGLSELRIRDKGLRIGVLFANSEAHRFALKLQRKRRDILS